MKGSLLAPLPAAAGGWENGHAVKNDVNILQCTVKHF